MKMMPSYEELLAKIEALTAVVQTLQLENELLKIENATLKEQLRKNSGNSSKPPSSDGYAKPAPKSRRTKSGKNAGGQSGHTGKGLSLLHTPDETIRYEPEICEHCGATLEGEPGRVAHTRYTMDIEVLVKVIAHHTISKTCGICKMETVGHFPEEIKATVQYGLNLSALAIALNTSGMMSINRTHEILAGVFGIPISTGTISSMVKNCAEKVRETVANIKTALSQKAVVHFDETGLRVASKLHWAHNASDQDLTYITVETKRGMIGINDSGVLPDFRGTAVHDCWAPYFSYPCKHALCNAHLLRELAAVTENTQQKWAEDFSLLLLQMKERKEQLLDEGDNQMSPTCLQDFSIQYDRLLERAKLDNPVCVKPDGRRGRIKKGKTRCLIERLEKYKGQVCLFILDFAVPFDNNQAERDIRMFKVKQKVSGCFRTLEGATDFAKIMSYLSSARKHGVLAFQAVKLALMNTPWATE